MGSETGRVPSVANKTRRVRFCLDYRTTKSSSVAPARFFSMFFWRPQISLVMPFICVFSIAYFFYNGTNHFSQLIFFQIIQIKTTKNTYVWWIPIRWGSFHDNWFNGTLIGVRSALFFFLQLAFFFCTLLGRGRQGDRPCSKPPFMLIYYEWITLSKIVYRKIIDFHVSPLLPTLLHDSYTTVWKLRKFSPIFFSFFLQKFREINVIRTKLHLKLFPRNYFSQSEIP